MSPIKLSKSSSKSLRVNGKPNFSDDLKSCIKRQVFPLATCDNKDFKNDYTCLKSKNALKMQASPSTPRCKTKSSEINACYTPSSLFRNANASSTPVSGRSIKKNKHYLNTSNQTNGDGEDRMKVAVRVRPLNTKECLLSTVTNIVRVNKNDITVLAGSSADSSSGVSHTFTYDEVFSSYDPESIGYADQREVFLKTAQPLIIRAFEGYNACLFAYGQTGSGKSYSMMGVETLEKTDEGSLNTAELNPEAGIIPRFCHELFRYIENSKNKLRAEVEVSYFEIYNEKIHDLLSVSEVFEHNTSLRGVCGTPARSNRKALKVREHPIWGPYVVDLSVHPVDSFEALRNWLIVGNSQRATAATGLNDKSSRSHSIFNIMLNITQIQNTQSDSSNEKDIQPSRRSKISLVDLAGSERISGSNGERIREGVHINKSLLTLGKVIAALSDDRHGQAGTMFVPYRESALTWLLRENLGGNSKTVMLATISPASIHVDETLATLRYACQARRIVNRIKVNESEHDKVIRELKSEIERLKSLHYEYARQKKVTENVNIVTRNIVIDTYNSNECEIENLKEQLFDMEKELTRAQKTWLERLKEAEDLRQSELHLLKRKGLAIALDNEQQQACLVNLTDDPMLSETLFYILPPGCVKIGRTRSTLGGTKPDIILNGPLVAHNHCSIENFDGKLFVTPENSDFETYLNGELVKGKKEMFHGDRLVIGGSHFFRVSNPFCVQKDKKRKLADFYQAYQEVLETQEHKLRSEIEEEKRIALSRIENERIEHERSVQERMDKMELEQLMLKCNKEILESEKKIIEEKSKNFSATESNAITCGLVSSNKSKFEEEINNIMQQPSAGSLHKIQLKVKEATQHCRIHNLLYEFKQSQVIDEFGIFHTKILIVDKRREKKAEWPIGRLEAWLDSVRDKEMLNADNIFSCFDIEWEDLDYSINESVHNSSSSSRISLNISALRDSIMKSKSSNPTQKSIKLTADINFEVEVNKNINDIKHSVSKLQNIYKKYRNGKEPIGTNSKSSEVFHESIESIGQTLEIIQSCFNETNAQH